MAAQRIPPPDDKDTRELLERLRLEQNRRQLDLDTRGILALLAIVGTFSLAFVQLFLGKSADVPAWAAAVVAGVVGFYFGGRNLTGQLRSRATDIVAQMSNDDAQP